MFSVCRRDPSGLQRWCKICTREYAHQHARTGAGRQRSKDYRRKYQAEHREACSTYSRRWRARHPEYKVVNCLSVKKYANAHRDKVNAYIKKYRKAHPEMTSRYGRKKYRLNIGYRLKQLLHGRIYQALRNGQGKCARTMDLIGCTLGELKQYIEHLFLPGMTWDNWGEWELHHKRGCISFDLTDAAQQRICFHYTNLQPLWYADHVKTRCRRVA